MGGVDVRGGGGECPRQKVGGYVRGVDVRGWMSGGWKSVIRRTLHPIFHFEINCLTTFLLLGYFMLLIPSFPIGLYIV